MKGSGTVPDMEIRSLRLPTDLAPVSALLEEAEAVDGHHPIGEHKYLVLTHGRPEDVLGLVGVVDDELVAYVALTPGRDRGWWGMELAVHPRHRTPKNFLELFEAGSDEVTRRNGQALRAWIFQPRLAEAAVRAGFSAERELYKLEVPLPTGMEPAYPEWVTVTQFRPGVDEAAWLDVNNRAFAGHPENGHWTTELLQERMAQPWFDPADLVMAWDQERLVGFCWVKREHPGQGEIYVVAIGPEYQGRGIGRALVIDGISRMEEVGDNVAFLYVDADNAVGLSLYRSLGFYVDHIDRSFVRFL